MERGKARGFWLDQLSRVREIVTDADPLQGSWAARKPAGLKGYNVTLKTVAICDILGRFGRGGPRWVRMFVFGFPIVGNIAQSGVYSSDPSVPVEPEPGDIRTGNNERFMLRARAALGSSRPEVVGRGP